MAQGDGDGTDGIDGSDGTDGATWYSGIDIPSTEGVNGDFYYREGTGDIYKKIGGSWDLIDNIKGLTGDDGADGATWLSDTATPTTEGKDGDFYLKTTDYEIYIKPIS